MFRDLDARRYRQSHRELPHYFYVRPLSGTDDGPSLLMVSLLDGELTHFIGSSVGVDISFRRVSSHLVCCVNLLWTKQHWDALLCRAIGDDDEEPVG